MTAVLATAASAGRRARPGRAFALRLVRLVRRRAGRPFCWYRLPLPLACLFAVIMPWVAVRDVRRSNTAFKSLCDVMLVAARQRGELGQPDRGQEAERPRHLHIVS